MISVSVNWGAGARRTTKGLLLREHREIKEYVPRLGRILCRRGGGRHRYDWEETEEGGLAVNVVIALLIQQLRSFQFVFATRPVTVFQRTSFDGRTGVSRVALPHPRVWDGRPEGA